jgi:SAM-dependent methyltransferase
MRRRFLGWLRCPDCRGTLAIAEASKESGDAVVDGALRCSACARVFPIRNRVPVFVESQDYAENFGWQWTRFHRLQRDSVNHTGLVRETILKRTRFDPEDLRQRTLLECGCGSGNDTEVLAELAGTLVSFDLSAGVHALPPELLARENLLVLQADLRRIPLAESAFDIVYCHRVIQHLPDPEAAFDSMARHVRPGGRVFVNCYDTHWKALCDYRYLWRPLTRRLPHEWVFRALEAIGPWGYRLKGWTERMGPLRFLGRLLIPFENHDAVLESHGSTLTPRERYEYALLVSFDALTPRYDNPRSPRAIRRWYERRGFEDVQILKRKPVSAIGRRPAIEAPPR